MIEAQAYLKEHGVDVFYAPKENLHLTLSFIGETDKLDLIKQTISEIKFEPFVIRNSCIGCFNNERAKVLWMGIEESEQLQWVAEEVRRKLNECGVDCDQKPFKAHITLVSKPSEFITDIEVQQSEMLVARIIVMETVSQNGKPVFLER